VLCGHSLYQSTVITYFVLGKNINTGIVLRRRTEVSHILLSFPFQPTPPIVMTEMLVCSLHVINFSSDVSCGLDEIRQRGLKGTGIVGRNRCYAHHPTDFISNPQFAKDVV
jgi:hypothetical protein